jgi:rfaE bifunctional protein kinase chain/domain
MNLDEVFMNFAQKKVLVIGDLMLDAYIWGKVDRISPEAPVPVLHVRESEYRLGGAANVAKNLRALGAEVEVAGVTGDDEEAKIMLDLFTKEGISCKSVVADKSRPTTVKQRIIANAQHLLRIDKEVSENVSQEISEEISRRIDKNLSSFDAIVFEDYDKGVLSEGFIQKFILAAKKRNIPTIIDPKKRNFRAYSGAYLFKPNLKELREGLNGDFRPSSSSFEADLKNAREMLGVENLMVTLSEDGVAFVEKNGNFGKIKAHKREISDVSGAGDTVVAVAALCTALNLPMFATADLSNLAGGLVCEHSGVVPIDKKRLQEEAKSKSVAFK